MKYDDIIEIPPWGVTSIWKEVNNSIKYLIEFHKDSLTNVFAVAEELKDSLINLFPLQDLFLIDTCMHCHSPCCETATVWFDFCDLIFIHLSGQIVPEYQLIETQTDTCRYHSNNGCLLPRLSRPWVCTLYLCPPQMVLLRKMDEKVIYENDLMIRSIKLIRKKLEQMFIEVTS